jgi:hypothetical protein
MENEKRRKERRSGPRSASVTLAAATVASVAVPATLGGGAGGRRGAERNPASAARLYALPRTSGGRRCAPRSSQFRAMTSN